MEIEIYIEEASLESVMLWVKSCVEIISSKIMDDDMEVFDVVYEGEKFPVTVQPIPDRPPCIGVWFNGEKTPWKSDVECARAAHKNLGVPVLCDPGEEYPLPQQFLKITKTGESVVCVD